MSLFRKSQPSIPPTPPAPTEHDAAPRVMPSAPAAPAAAPELFSGSNVDLPQIYRTASVVTEELDRVARAERLLGGLPSKARQTREIVDATLLAFGVDRSLILQAANKQLDALERFIRFSQDKTQAVLDQSSQRIAELEAEIERIRQASALATREGEDRARTVNNEMTKVQRVLEFFGEEADVSEGFVELDDATVRPPARPTGSGAQSEPTPKPR
jgi:hypothetical protein